MGAPRFARSPKQHVLRRSARAAQQRPVRRASGVVLCVGLLGWMLFAQLFGCANLPEVEGNLCGNSIIEAGEDCDTFNLELPGSKLLCRAPGKAGECHLDCTPSGDGVRPNCPDGWGCDFDNLCRAPSVNFTMMPRNAVGGIDTLASGDFDGDGRADLLSRKPHDLVGRGALAFHYFDARGNLVDSRSLPILSMRPAIARLSNDARDDLVFSDGRLGVFFGRQDRTWVPETYTPYVLADVSARVVGVTDGQVAVRTPEGALVGSAPIVTLTTRAAGTGLYVPIPDDMNGQLTLRAPLPGTAAELAGDLVTANIVDGASSPCREVLLAFRSASAFDVIDLCSVDAQTGLANWAADGHHQSIPLQPAAAIETQPLAVDLNADGHLDVLIGAGGVPYAALGDGRTLSPAVPYLPPAADPTELGTAFVMPLAVGDLTGDGVVDFVLPDRILLSWSQPSSPLPHYADGLKNLRNAWTVASIADLNGNGHLDVVAAAQGSLNVDFFNGSSSLNIVGTTVPSGRPVSQLAVGDFDGDMIHDVAFVEASNSDAEPDSLMVAYGAPYKLPSAPVAVARVRHIEQLGRFGDSGIDTTCLVATRTVEGHLQSSVFFLGGSPVRIPFSPLELLAFSTEGSLYSVPALSLSLGAFTAPGHKDVVSLVSDSAGVPGFWLVPSIDAESPTPEPLAGALAPGLLPSAATRLGKGYESSKMYATSALADLDHDGRDEMAWAMPYDDPAPPDQLASCAVQIFSVVGEGKREVRSRGLVTLDAPCVDPQLEAIDVDLDHFADLVLLTGSERGLDRKLFVLWNDGAGGFSLAATSVLDTGGDVPQAFTALPGTQPTGGSPGRPFGLAYVTKSALMLLPVVQARAFGAPTTLGTLTDGTSVVAADLNGDRAIDLAVADNGDLVVFHAELQP
jgi:hypothetical protein